MDLESDRVIKLIFPNGLPENLQDNPELYKYLSKLGNYKVDELKKEHTRLAEETKHLVEQTQDLAISNYKTFIQTAENSRSIFKEFECIESEVATLLEKLPAFSEQCVQFRNQSTEINEKRRLNSTTLQKNAQLLEILEIPQLMERCIREGRYEEALEMASCVQKMGQNQGHIPVIKSIVQSVEALWHTMLVQLVAQLRTDLQLPKCLQIVGFLRRMQAFENSELRLKFLQTRDAWFASTLKNIPQDNAQQHLTKTIEVTRINLFNIITQYRAIFPDDFSSDSSVLNPLMTSPTPREFEGLICDGQRLFYAWLHTKINVFLKTLQEDLERGVSSMEAVLDQCMYFGVSFSRVGADFRALMVPIFLRVIRRNFQLAIDRVNKTFEDDLEKYTLINKVPVHTRPKHDLTTSGALEAEAHNLSPPETLLDFLPLAVLCNGYLSAFNDLRLCTPIAVAADVTRTLQESLHFVAHKVLAFYRQEQQAFSGHEKESFAKLCCCFAYDLIPFVQRCIHAIFPQQQLTSFLGINLQGLEQSEITYLRTKPILEPLKKLLPQKLDMILKNSTKKQEESKKQEVVERVEDLGEKESKIEKEQENVSEVKSIDG